MGDITLSAQLLPNINYLKPFVSIARYLAQAKLFCYSTQARNFEVLQGFIAWQAATKLLANSFGSNIFYTLFYRLKSCSRKIFIFANRIMLSK